MGKKIRSMLSVGTKEITGVNIMPLTNEHAESSTFPFMTRSIFPLKTVEKAAEVHVCLLSFKRHPKRTTKIRFL